MAITACCLIRTRYFAKTSDVLLSRSEYFRDPLLLRYSGSVYMTVKCRSLPTHVCPQSVQSSPIKICIRYTPVYASLPSFYDAPIFLAMFCKRTRFVSLNDIRLLPHELHPVRIARHVAVTCRIFSRALCTHFFFRQYVIYRDVQSPAGLTSALFGNYSTIQPPTPIRPYREHFVLSATPILHLYWILFVFLIVRSGLFFVLALRNACTLLTSSRISHKAYVDASSCRLHIGTCKNILPCIRQLLELLQQGPLRVLSVQVCTARE